MFNDGSFHFLPATIEYQSGKLYTGLIVEAQNPNAQSYLNDFRNTMFELQTKFN